MEFDIHPARVVLVDVASVALEGLIDMGRAYANKALLREGEMTGGNVWSGNTAKFVCCDASPFLCLGAKAAAVIVKFRQMFAAREARKGPQPRIVRGNRIGRPCISLPEGFEDARTAWLEGRMDSREAAASCGIAVPTFAKRVRA